METLLPLIIQLISGAAGGNIVGALVKRISLGMLGNSLAGILGGGLGGQILGGLLGLPTGGGGLDIGSILGQVASGGAGGGIVMVLIGVIKSLLTKR
jgi:hypothetical protein